MNEEKTKEEDISSAVPTEDISVEASLEEKVKDLEAKMARMQRGEMEEVSSVDDESFIFLRLVEDKPLIGWDKKMKYTYDAKGNISSTTITLILKDGDKEVKKDVQFNTFYRITSLEKCKVIKRDTQTHVEVEGYTTKKYVKGYRTISTGKKVPLKVEYQTEMLTLERPNGEQLTVDVEYLN